VSAGLAKIGGASASLARIGDARLSIGDRAGALAAYEESLGAIRKLAAADPSNYGWQVNMVISLRKISTLVDPPRARTALHEALAMLERIELEDNMTAVQKKNWRNLLGEALATLPPE